MSGYQGMWWWWFQGQNSLSSLSLEMQTYTETYLAFLLLSPWQYTLFFFLCLLWGYIFLVSLWPFLLCHLWRLFLFSLAFKILDLQGLPLGCLLSSLCKHLYLSLPQSQIPSPPAQTTTVTSHIHSSCLLILQPLESSLYIQPEWFSKWQSDNPSAMQTPHWIPSSLRKKRAKSLLWPRKLCVVLLLPVLLRHNKTLVMMQTTQSFSPNSPFNELRFETWKGSSLSIVS